jgi:thymidylate synthase (FAD)
MKDVQNALNVCVLWLPSIKQSPHGLRIFNQTKKATAGIICRLKYPNLLIRNIKNLKTMNVKLVSITKSLVEEKELSAEELIVYVARVSNPSNQLNSETADKLIAYMVKNKHWSPFEMCDMTVEIVTSRGIAQQILRHRSFSFQEFSQRYAEATDFEAVQLRKSGSTNRQSSLEVFDPVLYGKTVLASRFIEEHLRESEALYKKLLAAGVAKECARFVLPLTTQTKIYMKGSVRSWIHYLQIRTDEHTQLEHRQIAMGILEVFKSNFPNISKALAL